MRKAGVSTPASPGTPNRIPAEDRTSGLGPAFDTPAIRAAEDAHAAELDAQYAAAAQRTATQAEIFERPALGTYRMDHQPPPFPSAAPPLPPRPAWRDFSGAELIALARDFAADRSTSPEISAETIVRYGRRSRLPRALILAALNALLAGALR